MPYIVSNLDLNLNLESNVDVDHQLIATTSATDKRKKLIDSQRSKQKTCSGLARCTAADIGDAPEFGPPCPRAGPMRVKPHMGAFT